MSSFVDNPIRDWIALSFVAGIGSRTAATLVDRFGSPAACFAAGRLSLNPPELSATRLKV